MSVIATCSGAAAAYVREGFTNIRIGMFLEIATTLGAIAGASRPPRPHQRHRRGLRRDAVVRGLDKPAPRRALEPAQTDRIAAWLRMDGSYPAAGPDGPAQGYRVRRVPAGFALMGLAGVLSGLLGIGSGAMKVLAMDQVMRSPSRSPRPPAIS